MPFSDNQPESFKEASQRFLSNGEVVAQFPDVSHRQGAFCEKWAQRKVKAALVVTRAGDELLYGLPAEIESWDNVIVEAAAEEACGGTTEKPYGDVHYCDRNMRGDGKNRFPVNNPERVRAAWSYSHHKAIMRHYTPDQLKRLHACIAAAWRKLISKDGPPSAE